MRGYILGEGNNNIGHKILTTMVFGRREPCSVKFLRMAVKLATYLVNLGILYGGFYRQFVNIHP